MSTERPVVLLAHSYFLRFDEKQWRRMRPYPPLATLFVAALLRARGFEVGFFDATLARGVAEFERILEQRRPAIVGIVEDNFNYLTKMCTVRMRDAAHEMMAAARDRGCHVFVNGSDATDHADAYLAAGAHAVIVGEPEWTALELVSAEYPWTERDIAGTIMAQPDGTIHTAAARPAAPAFDTLPSPAWDLIDAESYRVAWTRRHGRMSWNFVTSRGCPFRCNWCAKPVFGSKYNQLGPERVADEFDTIRTLVDPDHLWLADDIFGLTAKWIEAFADAIETRGTQIPFTMQSRASLMTEPVVSALRRAGAEEVWLGVESGSQQILDAMDKGTTLEQILDATRTLRQHGIRTGWFIQLGYLGEEWADILLTRDLIRRGAPDDIGVSVSYPLPGTRFYEMVEEQLGPQRNWMHSDDLAMMFRGAFDSDLYRRVRTLLHEEVDAGAAAVTADFDGRWEALAQERDQHRIAPLSPV